MKSVKGSIICRRNDRVWVEVFPVFNVIQSVRESYEFDIKGFGDTKDIQHYMMKAEYENDADVTGKVSYKLLRREESAEEPTAYDYVDTDYKVLQLQYHVVVKVGEER